MVSGAQYPHTLSLGRPAAQKAPDPAQPTTPPPLTTDRVLPQPDGPPATDVFENQPVSRSSQSNFLMI